MNPLIARLIAVFGEPESPDPKAYLAELDRCLVKLSAERLAAAGDRLLRTYRGRSFPAIGTVLTAVEDVTPDTSNNQDWRKLMPRVPMADYDAETRERFRKGAEFQKDMAVKYGSFDAYLTATAPTRDRQRQITKRGSFRSLSEISRRMTGERP